MTIGMARRQPPKSSLQNKTKRIVITGIGFICPVGLNAREAALAIRKKRSSFAADARILVADDRYGTVLRGATVSRMPVEIMPRDLRGTDRALALLSPVIEECIAGIHPWEVRNALWQIDNFLDPDDLDFPERLQKELPEVILPCMWDRGRKEPSLSRCQFFERIIQAAEMLRHRNTDQMAFIGCADSQVTDSRLKELLEAGKLKDAANPEGILVGEAAGMILLEKEGHARQRNAPIHAVVASWGRGTDENAGNEGMQSLGHGLTNAFHEAFAGLDDSGASINTVIADLNGERPRALDWAYAEGRIFRNRTREPVLKHPADALGDCGAAMGAALVIDAVGGFMLHHHAPHRVAITTSDESGARRVVCLEGAETPGRKEFLNILRRKRHK